MLAANICIYATIYACTPKAEMNHKLRLIFCFRHNIRSCEAQGGFGLFKTYYFCGWPVARVRVRLVF